jgi:Transposase DDE domain group 1
VIFSVFVVCLLNIGARLALIRKVTEAFPWAGIRVRLDGGCNPRFVVTDMKQSPRWLYEQVYCQRGDLENRINEDDGSVPAETVSSLVCSF